GIGQRANEGAGMENWASVVPNLRLLDSINPCCWRTSHFSSEMGSARLRLPGRRASGRIGAVRLSKSLHDRREPKLHSSGSFVSGPTGWTPPISIDGLVRARGPDGCSG